MRLARVLAEVVRRDEAACYAFVQPRPPVVRCVYHGVLEATRVLEVEVQLAVFGAVGGSRAGPDVGLEFVEAVGYHLWGVSGNLFTLSTLSLFSFGGFEELGDV